MLSDNIYSNIFPLDPFFNSHTSFRSLNFPRFYNRLRRLRDRGVFVVHRRAIVLVVWRFIVFRQMKEYLERLFRNHTMGSWVKRRRGNGKKYERWSASDTGNFLPNLSPFLSPFVFSVLTASSISLFRSSETYPFHRDIT